MVVPAGGARSGASQLNHPRWRRQTSRFMRRIWARGLGHVQFPARFGADGARGTSVASSCRMAAVHGGYGGYLQENRERGCEGEGRRGREGAREALRWLPMEEHEGLASPHAGVEADRRGAEAASAAAGSKWRRGGLIRGPVVARLLRGRARGNPGRGGDRVAEDWGEEISWGRARG